MGELVVLKLAERLLLACLPACFCDGGKKKNSGRKQEHNRVYVNQEVHLYGVQDLGRAKPPAKMKDDKKKYKKNDKETPNEKTSAVTIANIKLRLGGGKIHFEKARKGDNGGSSGGKKKGGDDGGRKAAAVAERRKVAVMEGGRRREPVAAVVERRKVVAVMEGGRRREPAAAVAERRKVVAMEGGKKKGGGDGGRKAERLKK